MPAEWLAAVEETALASALRRSVWAYPLVNAGHILGVALLVGGTVPLNLRLLGMWRSAGIEPLRRVLVRSADAGFLLAIICGVLLFVTRASAYLASGVFLSKMVVVGLAVGLTAGLRFMTRREMWNRATGRGEGRGTPAEPTGAGREDAPPQPTGAGRDDAPPGPTGVSGYDTPPAPVRALAAASLAAWIAVLTLGRLIGYF